MRTAQEILNDAQMLNNRSTAPSPFEIQKLAKENEALVNFYSAKTPPYVAEDKEQLSIAIQAFEALLKYCESPLYIVKMTYLSGLANQMQGKYYARGQAVDHYEKALELMEYYVSSHPEIDQAMSKSLIQERLQEIKSSNAVGHSYGTTQRLMKDLFKDATVIQSHMQPFEVGSIHNTHK